MTPVAAQVGTQFQIVAQSGEAAPDDDGAFFAFGRPVLNNDGLADFEGFLTGTPADTGLFLGDGSTDLLQLVREGQMTPNGNGEYDMIISTALNENGQVSFAAFLRNFSGPSSDDLGFFRADGVTDPVQLVREGDPAPDGNGTFGFSQDAPSFNASGQIGFRSGFADTAGGVIGDVGIFRTDDSGAVLQITREGDPAPDGVGMFENFQGAAMNDAGQVAFNTSLTNAGNTVIGIFLGNGTTPLLQIARAGQAIPDGSSTFSQFFDPGVNNAGQVVFAADLGVPPGTITGDPGIYLSDGSGGLAQLARRGDLLPGGVATITNFTGLPWLNDAGDVVFIAQLADAATGTVRSRGMYRASAAGPLVEIIGFEHPAPTETAHSSCSTPTLPSARRGRWRSLARSPTLSRRGGLTTLACSSTTTRSACTLSSAKATRSSTARSCV